jgi:Flp pilus assembly protein TadD
MSYAKKLNMKSFFMFIVMSLAVVSAPGLAQTNASTDASIEVNRAAAQQLLADGQPNAALRRIEQVIIAAPRDLSARFFRAQILVSLDRGDEVREELLLMSSLKLSTDDQAKAAALLAQIDGGGSIFRQADGKIGHGLCGQCECLAEKWHNNRGRGGIAFARPAEPEI